MTLGGLLLVPLVALVGLWGFVASITLTNALNEHYYSRLGASTIRADNVLITALDQERLTTFLWLSSPRRPPLSQLASVRQAVDVAVASYERVAADNPRDKQVLVAQLRTIPSIRDAIDSGTLSTPAAFRAYNGFVDDVFTGYLSAVQSDVSLYQHTLGALDTGRALEQLGRELTLVAAAGLDGGRMSAANGALFADAVASQRLLIGDAITLSDGRLHAGLQRLYSSPLHSKLALLEDEIDAASASGRTALQGSLTAWGPVSEAFLGQLSGVEKSDYGPLVSASSQIGRKLFLEAGLSGGLGLLAVLLSLFLIFRFGRRIRKELTGLHDGAQAMANERLPRVVKRLRDGDEVDVAAESPPLSTGKITEIVRVADAFSSVQRIAVDAAVGQANLRKGVSQVFLNLSLRNQSLLHRQLRMLDTMERATDNPSALADLFRLDHLTTRMRRHAESLIILSGASPGRVWRDPVPVLDVLRAAIAEVEDYVRVDIIREPPDSVVGAAVSDVVHLIAELVENATAFSPPNTRVEVRGDAVGFGVAVEIEDRGLGLAPEELAEINARLASPPGFDLANSDQLGLFVVGQLAVRHGIRVSLRESVYGGTTAIVLLPRNVIVQHGDAGTLALDDAGRYSPELWKGAPLPADADSMAGQSPAGASGSAGQYGQAGRHRFDRQAGADDGQVAVRGFWEPLNRQESSPQYSPGYWASPAITQEQAATPPAAAANSLSHAAPGGTRPILPQRVRQANLAPQLRGQGEDTQSTEHPAGEHANRSPEETRSWMSSLQDGWQRGRVDDLGFPGDGLGGWPGIASDAWHADNGEAP